MADVSFTVDGKRLTAPAGTLLIEACRQSGIAIPQFCYYPGLSLQAACRMCLVRIEKVPKLQTACTTPVAEGMVATTESPEIAQARKGMVQLLLGNHPLDCPVCDAGGECELQDMTFKYGAGESLYTEAKQHREEQQWSPVVYFDRPRCILCYRCVRVCDEGMDVHALAVENRGVTSAIFPNERDHLDCEQCGMCIDICPVGALTSGAYRYKTRPWEMNHVSTICTHCGDGCKTTLGVRASASGAEILRGDNRDRSGMNGDFLCVKGRYGFDFTSHPERLKYPLVRNGGGDFREASWEEAIEHAANGLRAARDAKGGSTIGVVGSNRTTNEENYLLQKFARTVLQTDNIDHHRTADYLGFARALSGRPGRQASLNDLDRVAAILLVGADATEQHPLVAWKIRANVRHNRARLYVIHHNRIKLERQARLSLRARPDGYDEAIRLLHEGEEALPPGSVGRESGYPDDVRMLRAALHAEPDLLIVFGPEIRGESLAALIRFGLALPHARFACLGDYVNSRGAADMGLLPGHLPGYLPIESAEGYREAYGRLPNRGMDLHGIFAAAAEGRLSALYVVGANPVSRYGFAPASLKETFTVAQDLFLTETARLADVVLPAASLYEKSGTVTNSFGDRQLVRKAADFAGARSDFELIVRLAAKIGCPPARLVPYALAASGVRADMGQSRGVQSGEADRHAVWLEANGLEPKLSPLDPFAILDEIERLTPGYAGSRLELISGGAVHAEPAAILPSDTPAQPDAVLPANDTLFTSGTLGRFSSLLRSAGEWQASQSEDSLQQPENAVPWKA